MNLRQQTAAMVAEYLARGGRIRRMPAPKPPVAADVLEYLQGRNIDVQPLPNDGGEQSYVYKGQVINLKTLVAIANRHRSRRHLPPFQTPGRVHH
jgi:hypothetical protein